jgi:hypothetical protein
MNAGLKVFILGPARSGTSAMFYAMQSVFGLDGEGESHIMPIFQRVAYAFARYAESFRGMDGVLANRLDAGAFRQLVIDHVRNEYGRIFLNGRFVDKTPGAEAIAGIPLIHDCFPDARIFLMRRSGIEVVQSHIQKFNAEFKDACEAWAACMAAILEVQNAGADVLLLDQHDLASAPHTTAAEIATYMGFPEKTQPLAEFFANNKVDRMSEHGWGTRLTLADVPWTAEQKAMFEAICGSYMRAFSFPM